MLDYARVYEGYGDNYGFNYGGGNTRSYLGVKVGNAQLQVNLQQNELTKINRDGFDMTGCAYPDLTGSTIQMSLSCADPKNLALAYRGIATSEASPAGAVRSHNPNRSVPATPRPASGMPRPASSLPAARCSSGDRHLRNTIPAASDDRPWVIAAPMVGVFAAFCPAGLVPAWQRGAAPAPSRRRVAVKSPLQADSVSGRAR